MKVTSELNVYQFKNAIHLGYMNSHQPFNGSQSLANMLKSNIRIHPEGSPTSSGTPRTPTHARQAIDNLGMTVDDDGNILIAEWKNSKVTGSYFLFKPSANNNPSASRNAGVVQFGSMVNNMLEGDNYLFDVNGSIAKSSFQRDRIQKQCVIYHRYKLKHQRAVQCKVLTFQSNDYQKSNQKENKKFVPPIKNMPKISSNKKNLPTEVVEVSQLKSLTQFLEGIASVYIPENSLDDQRMQFRKFNFNQSQYFVGFSKPNTSKQAEQDFQQSINNFNGFGIIFRNEWPYKYGFFQSGKLSGFGRYYQSELQVLDGFFENDQLIEGFILDYYQNRTYFGQRLAGNFEIIEKMAGIATTKLLQYKKMQHLKSFDFLNNYFNLPNIMFKSPWPYRVAQVLQEQNSIKHVINEFRNELDISQIQRKGQNTEDKVEEMLIKEMNSSQSASKSPTTGRSKANDAKTRAINQGISVYLKMFSERSLQKQVSDQLQLERNIQQYKGLKKIKYPGTSRKESARKTNQTPRSNKISKLNAYYKVQLTQRSTQRQEPLVEDGKNKDFSELINSYKEYENKMNGYTGRQRALQSLSSNKNRIQSRSDMIKQDHKLFIDNLKKTPPRCQHKSKKSALQLDQIYRLHFKHQKK